MGTRTSRKGAAPAAALCAAVAGFAIAALPVVTAGAAAAPAPVSVTVRNTRVWSPTAIELRAGDTLRITASGVAHFGAPPIDRVTPAGKPWSQHCSAIVHDTARFPAPGLACWSLIARVGASAPLEIGRSASVRALAAGRLSLGVNDNDLRDNSGGWTARITVTAAPAATHASNSTLLLAFVAAVLAAALLALALWKLGAGRDATFRAAPNLRVGHVDVRVKGDRSLRRLGPDGTEAPFAFETGDFVDVPFPNALPRFSWGGLSFRAVKSRVPLLPAHGEVVLFGQYVTGSGGVVAAADGFTRARIPASLPGAWVFVRGAVNPDDTTDIMSFDGEVTVFVRADRPLAPQVDAMTASISRSLAHLEGVIDLRPPAVAVQSRLSRRY